MNGRIIKKYMRKHYKFDVYADCGHSWLKVPMKMINDFGIRKNFSSYSYKRGDFAYLEEDCDAGIFIKSLDEMKIDYNFRWHNTEKRSKIRNYESFS